MKKKYLMPTILCYKLDTKTTILAGSLTGTDKGDLTNPLPPIDPDPAADGDVSDSRGYGSRRDIWADDEEDVW